MGRPRLSWLMVATVEPEVLLCLFKKIAASHLRNPSVTLRHDHHCSSTWTAIRVQLSGKAHKSSDHAHHCEWHCVVITLVVKL